MGQGLLLPLVAFFWGISFFSSAIDCPKNLSGLRTNARHPAVTIAIPSSKLVKVLFFRGEPLDRQSLNSDLIHRYGLNRDALQIYWNPETKVGALVSLEGVRAFHGALADIVEHSGGERHQIGGIRYDPKDPTAKNSTTYADENGPEILESNFGVSFEP